MNKIDLIYKRSKWRPSLVMCVNNMVIKQNIAAFRANPIPTYLAWKARWFVRRKPDHIHYFDLRESEAFQSDAAKGFGRSEEHTSELQSLMRISYAVFCLKKNKKSITTTS